MLLEEGSQMREPGVSVSASLPVAGAIDVIVSDGTGYEQRLEPQNQQPSPPWMRLLVARGRELTRRNAELMDENRRLKDLCAEFEEQRRWLKGKDAIRTSALFSMSHEIRSPLDSIYGLTTLLLRCCAGEQAKLVGYIRKAADALLDVVNVSVDLARLEGGDIEVRPAPFEAAATLDTLRGLLPEPLVDPAVRLIFEEPAGVPTLFSDESKVLQILRNLLNNALKFTTRGEVRVGARYDHDLDRIYFSVRDSGIGIAPLEQEQIFARRGAAPAESSGKRSGLGLPLCLRLAALLDGGITLESELGAGSTFVLAIPRRFMTKVQDLVAGDQSRDFGERKLRSSLPEVHDLDKISTRLGSALDKGLAVGERLA